MSLLTLFYMRYISISTISSVKLLIPFSCAACRTIPQAQQNSLAFKGVAAVFTRLSGLQEESATIIRSHQILVQSHSATVPLILIYSKLFSPRVFLSHNHKDFCFKQSRTQNTIYIEAMFLNEVKKKLIKMNSINFRINISYFL